MKKNIKKVMCSFIILIFVLATSTLAVDFEIVEAPYSEAYEEYLGLSDEEKSEVLEPRKYAISNTYSSTNEALLANGTVTLKNYLNLLRAEASITDSKFSLKTLIANNVTIRNQEETGWCWAFTALSSLETNLALQNYYNDAEEVVYDYSEKHMAYAKTQMYTDKTNEYGWDYEAADGGNWSMATSYLTNGQGAVSEDEMTFDNDDTTKVTSSTVEDIDAETTVDNYIWFDSLDITNSSTTTEEIENLKTAIKEHIIDYGSVYAAVNASLSYFNISTGGIYNNETTTSNHGVSIIGWDDSYSKDNFNTSPTSDGAWIVRNSWGEKLELTYEDVIEAFEGEYTEDEIVKMWDTIVSYFTEQGYTYDEDNKSFYEYIGVSEEDGGEGYGYCYVSYEDVTVYTNCTGIVSADDDVTYENIYQLDELGYVKACALTNSNIYDTYMANVFTRTTTDTEYLTSVGITNYTSGTYEVYINPNGTSKSSSNLTQATFADGTTQITLTAGYNTIDLKEAFELTGTNFVIVMKEIANGTDYTYYPVEYSSSENYTDTATSNSGESFITLSATGYFDSNNWCDIGDTSNSSNYRGNLCIKGFTVTSYSGSVASVSSTSADVTNADYSAASANLTSIVYTADDSSVEYDLTVEITGIAVEDEDETFEQYFYLSTDSAKDTSSISSSYWKKVDSFEKQSDGTYTITLTIDEETYQDDIDSDEDYLYVYIKEIATKDSDTSTLYTDGLVITVDSDNVTVSINASSGTTTYSSTSTNDTSDSTTASSSLPYTGIRTLIVILFIAGICVIVTCIKYRSMNDIK